MDHLIHNLQMFAKLLIAAVCIVLFACLGYALKHKAPKRRWDDPVYSQEELRKMDIDQDRRRL
jgi:hypothetical protein